VARRASGPDPAGGVLLPPVLRGTPGVLLWVFIRHAEVYLRMRCTLVSMTLLVLPVFWAVPMSPPRFALSGIADIVAEHDL
jgi:hypothetical protein